MQISSLYLRNFRNYSEAFFSFSPGVNLIVGENGVGKTNLLEALYLLMTGRSFRTSHFNELPTFGTVSFYLEVHFVKNNVTQMVKMYAAEGEKKVWHNVTALTTLHALFGLLQGVFCTPQDPALVRGDPAYRREFIDLHIAQANPLHLYHLTRYAKALKQRNYLLRRKVEKGVDVWEEEMAKSAAYIVNQRIEALEEIEKCAAPIQHFLSETKETLSLKYRSSTALDSPDLQAVYKLAWERLRKKELDMGYTLLGPHRDDIHILLSEKMTKAYASEGQARTTALALRLSSWERLKQIAEELPLFAIDDVGISLDTTREEKLYNYLPRLGQVFLTSPHHVRSHFHTISLNAPVSCHNTMKLM